MDNFQQPTPPIQSNNTSQPTISIISESPKSKRWLYILSGILVVGVVVAISVFFLKGKPSQPESTSPSAEEIKITKIDRNGILYPVRKNGFQ